MGRLLSITAALLCPFLLLSIRHEGLFYIAITIAMYLWLILEFYLAGNNVQVSRILNSCLSGNTFLLGRMHFIPLNVFFSTVINSHCKLYTVHIFVSLELFLSFFASTETMTVFFSIKPQYCNVLFFVGVATYKKFFLNHPHWSVPFFSLEAKNLKYSLALSMPIKYSCSTHSTDCNAQVCYLG